MYSSDKHEHGILTEITGRLTYPYILPFGQGGITLYCFRHCPWSKWMFSSHWKGFTIENESFGALNRLLFSLRYFVMNTEPGNTEWCTRNYNGESEIPFGTLSFSFVIDVLFQLLREQLTMNVYHHKNKLLKLKKCSFANVYIFSLFLINLSYTPLTRWPIRHCIIHSEMLPLTFTLLSAQKICFLLTKTKQYSPTA